MNEKKETNEFITEFEKYLKGYRCSIIFINEINNIDQNSLNMNDLKKIQAISDELFMGISDFNLEEYEYDDEMCDFIFNVWKKEAHLNYEIAEKLLINKLKEVI